MVKLFSFLLFLSIIVRTFEFICLRYVSECLCTSLFSCVYWRMSARAWGATPSQGQNYDLEWRGARVQFPVVLSTQRPAEGNNFSSLYCGGALIGRLRSTTVDRLTTVYFFLIFSNSKQVHRLLWLKQ